MDPQGVLDGTASDVTDVVYPEAVPQNPDGTPRTEGEISEEQVQQIGAVDLESAAHNTRTDRIKMGKLSGKRNVPWNTTDPLEQLDSIRSTFAGEWPAMRIHVARVIPEPVMQFPPVPAASIRNTGMLYELVERYHGASPPATYQVKFIGASGAWRGSGHIGMPDKTAPYPAPQTYAPPQPAPGPLGQQSPVVVNMPPQQRTSEYNGQTELIQAIISQQQVQTQMMMGVLKDIVESLKKPQMPPGFIPLPEGWPETPKGYTRVPGGCVPEPPQPVSHAAAAPQTVYVPQSAPVAAPASDPAAQMASMAKSFGGLWRTMQDLRTMIEGAEDLLPEPAGPAAPATPQITPIPIGGGISMIPGPNGTTNWPATLLGALPKIVDGGQKVLDTYGKVMAKQAEITQRTVQDRIRLAHAVAQVPGLQPQAPPPQPATAPPPPQPVPQPAPPPQPVARPARKMPENPGTLWG